MKEKVGIAIIGAGIQGSLHAHIVSQNPYAELIAIIDKVEEKAKKLAIECKAKKYYADYDIALEDPNIHAVIVATPDFLHKEPVIKSIKAKKHVLCEKPLATNVNDAYEMVKESELNNVKLMVGFEQRFNPIFVKLKQVIDEGEIGIPLIANLSILDTISIPTKMLKWAEKTSPAYFLLSHGIDLVRWFFCDEVDEVYAKSNSVILKNKGINTEDFLVSITHFKRGGVASFETNWILPEAMPRTSTGPILRITGSEGYVMVEMFNQGIAICSNDKYYFPNVLRSTSLYGRIVGFLTEEINHFIRCIIENKEPICTGKDGLAVTQIISAMHESARKGKPIRIDPLV
jgi:predicted dehydrogenase